MDSNVQREVSLFRRLIGQLLGCDVRQLVEAVLESRIFESIESRVSDKAGLPYETIESLQGVEQLDRLSDSLAVVISRLTPDSAASSTSIALP